MKNRLYIQLEVKIMSISQRDKQLNEFLGVKQDIQAENNEIEHIKEPSYPQNAVHANNKMVKDGNINLDDNLEKLEEVFDTGFQVFQTAKEHAESFGNPKDIDSLSNFMKNLVEVQREIRQTKAAYKKDYDKNAVKKEDSPKVQNNTYIFKDSRDILDAINTASKESMITIEDEKDDIDA